MRIQENTVFQNGIMRPRLMIRRQRTKGENHLPYLMIPHTQTPLFAPELLLLHHREMKDSYPISLSCPLSDFSSSRKATIVLNNNVTYRGVFILHG